MATYTSDEVVKTLVNNPKGGQVSAYAPPECSRRILIGRIIEARGQAGLSGKSTAAEATEKELMSLGRRVLQDGRNAILFKTFTYDVYV